MKRIVTTMALVPVCLAVAAQSLITEIELPEMYVQSIVSPSPGSYNYPAATGEQLVMDFVAVPMTGIVDAIMDDVESQLAASGADSFLELVSVTVSSTSGRIVFDLDANVTGTTRTVHVSARGDEVSYYQSAAVFSVTPASATRLPGEQLDIVLSLSMPGEPYVLKKNGSTVATRTGAGGSISFPVTVSYTAGGLSSLRDSLDFTLLAECLYDEAPEYGYEELSYAAPSGEWPVPDTVRLKGLLTHERLAVIGPDGAATGETVERAFYYDRQGRPVQTAERNHLGRQSRVSTRYDFAGNPVEIREYHQASALSCISSGTEIRYDGRGRRTWESVETGGLPAVDMEYCYDSRDNPVTVKYTLPDTVFTEVYGYNVQGWQTASDSPYFGMELSYYDPVEAASVPSYSGNVSEWRWDYGAAGPAGGYSFLYDSQSRLTDAGAVGSAEAGTWTEKDIVYDRNGNMLSLDRYDGEDAESLVFSYSGDRLQSAAGFSGLSGGSGAVYLYDLDGNTVYDPVNGVGIGYNHMNLIGTVGREDTVLAEYRYLADGTKLGAVDGSGNGVEYLGNAVFRRAGDSLSEESLAFSGGRVSVSGRGTTLQISPRVYLRDHLGSTRVIVGSDGEVLERDSYYPFGLRRPDSAPTDSLNRYRYNGKEEQSFAGLPYLDYGARMYDPATARWLSPDPLSDQYYSLSPYSFCAGNPVNYIDPDGKNRRLAYNTKKRTITVKATFYHNIGITSEVNAAISLFNNMSGLKYEDEYGDTYKVKFDLSSERSLTPAKAARSDPAGNYIELSSRLGTTGKGDRRLGGTLGNHILIDENYINNIIVVAHEIGHTLGAALPDEKGDDNHSDQGLMSSSIDNPGISSHLDQKSVNEIIQTGQGPIDVQNTWIDTILNLFKH